MTEIRVVRDYSHPPEKVWRALTDPDLLALWSMRPEGFSLEIGARFRFYGKANSQWRGYVDCQMLEVRAPSRLRYSWIGDDSGKELIVTYTLDPIPSGTRLTVVHSGYTGARGFLLAKLIMTPGWKKMLDGDFRAVLDQTDDNGDLRPESKLLPKF